MNNFTYKKGRKDERQKILQIIEEFEKNPPFMPDEAGVSYWYDKLQDLKQKLKDGDSD